MNGDARDLLGPIRRIHERVRDAAMMVQKRPTISEGEYDDV